MKLEIDMGTVSIGDDTVRLSGRITYNLFSDFVELRKMMTTALMGGHHLIDIRDLLFLSSTGRATLTMACTDCHHAGIKDVKLWIRPDIEWQEQVVHTLMCAWPSLSIIGRRPKTDDLLPPLDNDARD